jgi:acetylornithine/succinyldiaminopimelate/putrescine aminotransferase
MPSFNWRLFNDSGAEGIRLLQQEIVQKTIASEMLLDRVTRVGDHLKHELKVISGIENVRGLGTQIGFDLSSEEKSLNLLKFIRSSGISVNRAGSNGVGLNPALICDIKHADEFLSVLKAGVKIM